MIITPLIITTPIPAAAVRRRTPRPRPPPRRARQRRDGDERQHEAQIQADQESLEREIPDLGEKADERCEDGVDQGGGDDALDGALGADDAGEEVREVDAEEDEGDEGGEELDDADGGEEVGVEGVGGDGLGDGGEEGHHGGGGGGLVGGGGVEGWGLLRKTVEWLMNVMFYVDDRRRYRMVFLAVAMWTSTRL